MPLRGCPDRPFGRLASQLPAGNLQAWLISRCSCPRTCSRSRSGSTTSPRTSFGRPPTSGTSARSSRGRSFRRRPRSGCTGSTSWRTSFAEPSGLMLPVAAEELFWGDAGIGLAIFGSGLAAAGISGNGTPEQVMEWVPQCYGTADDVKLGAFCVSEPDAGSDVSSLRTRAVYDEAKDEWVLNGTKAWITNGGIADVHVVVAAVDPELKGRGQASFVVPPGTPGRVAGAEVQEARHPGVAHGRGDPRRRAGAGPVPARRQGEARRQAGPGSRGGSLWSEAAGDGDVRGDPSDRRRPGARHRPGRVRVRARLRPASARPSASRSS